MKGERRLVQTGFLYKQFKDKLIQPLLDMLLESYEKEDLPPSLRGALITLLLKPGKAPTDCASYRAISLLNTDSKILCKTLARRLEELLLDMIKVDKTASSRGGRLFIM